MKIGRRINTLGTLAKEVPNHAGWDTNRGHVLGAARYWREHSHNGQSITECVRGKEFGYNVSHWFEADMPKDEMMEFIDTLYPEAYPSFGEVD